MPPKIQVGDKSREYIFGERLKICFKDDAEWLKFYCGVKEEILVDAPAPYGKYAKINTWVDAYHAVDCLTRCIQTGLIVFIKLAPSMWYSKR